MAEPIDDGRPFEVGDLWRPSSLVAESEKTDSLFDIQDKQQASFDLTSGDETAHFVFDNDGIGLPSLVPLALPDLEPMDVQLNRLVSAKAAAVESSTDQEQSIWDDDFSLEHVPELRTWESFDKSTRSGPESIARLSEAGPLAFDAAMHEFDKSRAHNGVLPSDAVLRALNNLCLGRSSVFFQWDQSKERFIPVLDNVSISGLSKLCSESMIAEFLEFGSLIVKLRQFTEVKFDQNVCPSILAFRSGVASVLSAVSEIVSKRMSYIKSWLQLQNFIARIRRLLQAIWSSIASTEGLNTDVAVISAFADYVYTAIRVDDIFDSIWENLLARVSLPWLERLAADLGLDDTGAVPTSSDTDVGASDDPSELRSPSSRKKVAKQQLSFIRPEDNDTINHTKRTLKLLYNHVPGHPLITKAVWGIKCPTECFLGPFLDHSTIIKRTRAYEVQMIGAMLKAKSARPLAPDRVQPLQTEQDIYSRMHADEDAQKVYLSDLVTRMSDYSNEIPLSKLDTLYEATSTTLLHHHDLVLHGELSPASSASFNMLDQAIPLIKTQYRLANSALMRHLFRECNLRQHLELQRSFHLLQNGDFVDRLSTALFSAEAQSAERRRGALPTGQMIGLRLGANGGQRWPPASSELQLTLMGILNEASRSRSSGYISTLSSSKEQLLGDLSFAIRELSEDEIEHVLDPTSTHALDFLRLQYTVPAPLDTVLTPEILGKYDDTFRFLLVLLRLIHATTSCRVQVSLARPKPTKENRQAAAISTSTTMFVIEAHHFVSVVMSFVMDFGINASWRHFSRSLDVLEQGLKLEDEAGEIMTRTAMSVDGLRDLHDDCLERIRGCLFLRRRQEKIRIAVNAVMSAILKCVTKLSLIEGDSDSFQAEYSVFREAMTALYISLQEMIDRPLGSTSTKSDLNTESDAYRMLLLQLRWRDYV